ncbi:MAG: hypothetical protein ACI867_002078, partial [Glaciecola sp.]
TTEPTSTSEHPLRSRNAVPRSDIRRATVALAEALDAMLGAHASGADGDHEPGLDVDSPQKQQVVQELLRCLGGRATITGVAVGDVLLQITCADEAGAAAVSAVVNHTGLGGKASWFKGNDEHQWIVLVIPTR